jgi:hypothetical protein
VNIISLLAIFGLTFGLKETDGPFGIMNWLRNKLMNNKYVGVFFYQLFSCYFCLGCHASYIVYLLQTPHTNWSIFDCIIWIFAGGIFSYTADIILGKLSA